MRTLLNFRESLAWSNWARWKSNRTNLWQGSSQVSRMRTLLNFRESLARSNWARWKSNRTNLYGKVAQLVRAHGSYPWGREFESLPCYFFWVFALRCSFFQKEPNRCWCSFLRTTALVPLSCSTLDNRELTNASSLQNLLKNTGGAIGTSLSTTMISRFSQIHQNMMVCHLSFSNNVYIEKLNSIA